ncbi:MAG: tetratricopeptide repeat protein, partial [Chloroflexota bacterium]|nr:tetratricopeptide repeat protein [Chloroflexota bacterium]
LRAALHWSQQDSGAEQSLLFGLRLAGALAIFWRHRGYLSEGRSWLKQVLAAARDGEHAAGPSPVAQFRQYRAKALAAVGHLAWAQSDYPEATALLEQSLALYRELGKPRQVARALQLLGGLAYDQGDYQHAVRLSEEALVLCRQFQDGTGIAHVLHRLGDLARDQGDYERAAVLLEEALAHYRALGDTGGTAWLLNGMGDLKLSQGDVPQALDLYHTSRDLFAQLGETPGTAMVLYNLGRATLQGGDPSAAAHVFGESLAHARQVDDTGLIAAAQAGLGAVARAEGDAGRGAALYAQSLRLFWKLGVRSKIVECLEGLAGVAVVPHAVAAEARLPHENGDVAVPDVHGRYAARLLGAAEAQREQMGMPVRACGRAAYEQVHAAAAAQLDAAAFAAAWAEGRAMTLEQAVTCALDELMAPTPQA